MKFKRKIAPNTKSKSNFITKKRFREDEINFDNDTIIEGSSTAIGTLANCSGGITPWRTILTCEENYDMFYGERNLSNRMISKRSYEWLPFHTVVVYKDEVPQQGPRFIDHNVLQHLTLDESNVAAVGNIS